MKKLIAMALMGFNALFGFSDGADPNTLTEIRFGIYSQRLPVPIAYLSYDTNKDGKEDRAQIYQMEDTGAGFKMTRLLEEDIDRDFNGLYDWTEIYTIVDLEKEAQVKRLNDLLKKSKSIQKENCA